MVTKDHADKLSRAIEATGLAQPVSASHSENRVQVMCRVAKENEERWLKMVESVLVAGLDESNEVHAWQNHICRNYFIKEDSTTGSRRMVYGWNFSVHSKEMGHSLNMILKLLRGEPIRVVSNRELTEFPLQASPNRNAPKNGRGVQTVGDRDFHPGRKT